MIPLASWKPDLIGREGAAYARIAEALVSDIRTGKLPPGTRLPPYRELAHELGVTPGTVSRAFAEAIRLGLVEADGRRGSRVRGTASSEARSDHEASNGRLDLRGHRAPLGAFEDAVRQASIDVALQPVTGSMSVYGPVEGWERHRRAGAAWLETVSNWRADPDQIVVCNGAQHALLCGLLATCRAGDSVATERLTYAGLKAVAPLLGLRLVPIDMDEHGLLPDSLDEACRGGAIRALVTVPDLHNPTTSTQPRERRADIARVADRHGVTIIEDAVYAGLTDEPMEPVIHFSKAPAIRLVGLSKTLGPALRVGYLQAPSQLAYRVIAAVRATSWTAAPLQSEVASRMIETGAASHLLEQNRLELQSRNRIVRDVLGSYDIRTSAACPHAWLRLPDPWTRELFREWALNNGLEIASAEVFSADRDCADHAVRISTSPVGDHRVLERALRAIADALGGPVPGAHLMA